MDIDRWERIQALFHAALDLPPDRRADFLAAECEGDAELLRAVRSLLEEDARGGSLLDRELGNVAHDVLEDHAAPGRRSAIGPYRIRELLGEGGMGVVYLAEREDLGNLVAVKMLRDASLSPARRERFSSEQRALAQLNHPGIARLYDADTLPDGTPYFVMEYVRGVSLTEYCTRRAGTLRERLQLFRAACETVRHAHGMAIVHRDLKPSNILVTEAGAVKLLDFGIAKQLESLDRPADPTRTGLRLMTPAYAAPEQLTGDPVGTFTDVYALGVILYELLTGRLPFDVADKTPGQAERTILETEPPRPSGAGAGPPQKQADTGLPSATASPAEWADLDVLCMAAMHKDPQRRYRTVDALIRDVDHFLAGEPLQARPDSLAYRFDKFLRRNRRPVAAAALALALVVGLVAFYTWRLAAARDAALAEAASNERIQRFMLSLFEGGGDGFGPADTLRVVTLVDRGVREARLLDAEPEVQTELYRTLGGIYRGLGHLERADTLLRLALDQRQALLGDDHPEVGAAIVALGLLRESQADYIEAERLVRDGLQRIGRRMPAAHPSVVQARNALGRVLIARGVYDDAIAVLEETVRTAAGRGMPEPDIAVTLHYLANAHYYAGRFAISDSLNRLVLALNRERRGERHPSVADDLINLGAVQFSLGNYTEAERYNREALEIMLEYYGPDHPQTASNLTILARSLIPQERYDEALAVLQRALIVRERVFGHEHPAVASTLNELASTAAGMGDLDTAESLYTRMAEIYLAVHGDSHFLLGVAWSNLAGVHHLRGEYERAEALARDVVALYTRTLSADHSNTGMGRIRLGRALAGQHRWVEAEVELVAGLDILMRDGMNPAARWPAQARDALVIVYDSLGRPEEAARYRTPPE